MESSFLWEVVVHLPVGGTQTRNQNCRLKTTADETVIQSTASHFQSAFAAIMLREISEESFCRLIYQELMKSLYEFSSVKTESLL